MKKQLWILPVFLFLWLNQDLAQPADSVQAAPKLWKPRWIQKKEAFKLSVKSMVQLWSIYSTDFEIYNTTTGAYERVDHWFNVSLRRARLAFSGEPYPGLQYFKITN
ncbi:MAG: hypothetical protein SH848_12895 [Saprospiraceae bacterium]|nr:hypothetical protein [Saprospiraceae bacterium]MDZ4704825.1 hypothetical protein [Saprospiraceae bacterium]